MGNRLYRHKETDFRYTAGGYSVEVTHGTDRREKDIETLIIPIDYLRKFVEHIAVAQKFETKLRKGGESRTNKWEQMYQISH